MQPELHQEIEFKWHAASQDDFLSLLEKAKLLGAQPGRRRNWLIRDLYLDTDDLFFQSTRTKCRLRQAGRHCEITFKGATIQNRGLFEREERNYRIPFFLKEPRALRYCRKHIFRPLIGERKLMTLFRLKNRRLVQELKLPGATRAALCFDDVILSRPPDTAHLREIELEFLRGSLKSFKTFSKALESTGRLIPNKASKFTTAVEKFSLENQASTLSAYTFSKYDNSSFAASQILNHLIRNLIIAESRLRTAQDDEAVHDMRVALRRIRSCIRLFKSFLPPFSQRLLNELRKLGSQMGQTRNLEILAKHIDKARQRIPLGLQPKVRTYRKKLGQKINRTKNQLLRTLNAKPYALLTQKLARLSAYGQFPSRSCVLLTARKTIRKKTRHAERSSRKALKKLTPESLHKLRIALKKLRYTCEFFKPLGNGTLKKFIKKTVKFQDLLGTHQDMIICSGLLRRSPLSGKAQNLLQNYCLREMERAKHRFSKKGKEYFRGKTFRLLNQTFRRE